MVKVGGNATLDNDAPISTGCLGVETVVVLVKVRNAIGFGTRSLPPNT